MRTVLGVALILFGGWCGARAASIQEIDARQTVVIANGNLPESVELARYYMERRGIPTNHLCVLDLPVVETMSRWMYEHRLREPLQEFLRQQQLVEQIRRDPARLGEHDNPWRTVRVSIRYVVSMHGVPLRIAETRPFLLKKLSRLLEDPMQRDGAAVDSELSVMLWDAYDLRGIAFNPMYNLTSWPRNERQPRPILIAARLDGPTTDQVKGMIDAVMDAERNGLHGRVYIDQRSIRDPDYALGDHWLRGAAHLWQHMGYEVVVERSEALFGDAYPMEDAAIYLGWYAEHVTGPLRRPDFRFRPGAIAYHLHSTSARSLRTADTNWAGPLLARGAAAVMGAVDEPYLTYTPDLHVFSDRLAGGYSFGESAYFSQRALSWQITVVGDPLYRPFSFSIDERIQKLSEAGNEEVVWELMRRMNQYLDSHQFSIAMKFGRDGLQKHPSLPMREKMAELYAKNELWEDALREFNTVIDTAPSDLTSVRVGQRLVWMLRLVKQDALAEDVVQRITSRWPQSPYLPFLQDGMP